MTKISIKTLGYVALNGKNNAALLSKDGNMYKTSHQAKNRANRAAAAQNEKELQLREKYEKEVAAILSDCAAYAEELKLSEQKAAERRRRADIREAEANRVQSQIIAANKIRAVKQEKQLKKIKGMW